MGCGCNKKNQRRTQAVRVSGPTTNGSIRLNSNKAVSAQQAKVARNLNEGGISAEKRRIQALRRTEILKKLGKI